jgi:hypothetical protein
MNRKPVLCIAMLIALTVSGRPVFNQASREFVGTINQTLKVRLRLSRSGQSLTGSYIYERMGSFNLSLRLDGAMTSENEFYLDEFEGDKKTGRFEGKFVSKDWLEGTWSSTSTKKQMPFSAWVTDGQQIPSTKPQDRVSGRYRRVNQRGGFDRHSAELDVWLLKNGEVRVLGDSSWVGDERTGNVSVGSVEGIFALQVNKLFFKGSGACRFTVTFGGDSLEITEDNQVCGGQNVSFDGKYRRVGAAKSG